MTHFHVTAKLINTPFNQDRMLINRYMGGDYRGTGDASPKFCLGGRKRKRPPNNCSIYLKVLR